MFALHDCTGGAEALPCEAVFHGCWSLSRKYGAWLAAQKHPSLTQNTPSHKATACLTVMLAQKKPQKQKNEIKFVNM